jgi:hypothetical protein
MSWLWWFIPLAVIVIAIATVPITSAMRRERAERGSRNAPHHEPTEYVGEGGSSVSIVAASSGAVSGSVDGQPVVGSVANGNGSTARVSAAATQARAGTQTPTPPLPEAGTYHANAFIESAGEREDLARAREAVAAERDEAARAASAIGHPDAARAAQAAAHLHDAATEARHEAADLHERAADASRGAGEHDTAAELTDRADDNRLKAGANTARRDASIGLADQS